MPNDVLKREKKIRREEIRKMMESADASSVYKELKLSSEAFFILSAKQLGYLDKMQVAMFNQIRAAYSNDQIKDHPLFGEIQRLRITENEGTESEVKSKKTKIAKLIKVALSETLKLPEDTVEELITKEAQASFDVSYQTQAYQIAEEKSIKELEKYLNQLPIYTGYMRTVRGLGSKTSAKLLAILKDLTRFPTPSSLWHYTGTHVGEDGFAEKKKHGQRLTSNPEAKSLLLGVIGPNFLKQDSQYRVIYDKRVEKTKRTHPEWWHLNPDGTKSTEPNKHPKHGYKDGVRVMMKRFLVELWRAGYFAKGLKPPCNPYILNDPRHHLEPDIVPYDSHRVG